MHLLSKAEVEAASSERLSTMVDVEIARGQFTPCRLNRRRGYGDELLIVVPRNLENGVEIKAHLRAATTSKLFAMGRPQCKEGVAGTHRVSMVLS